MIYAKLGLLLLLIFLAVSGCVTKVVVQPCQPSVQMVPESENIITSPGNGPKPLSTYSCARCKKSYYRELNGIRMSCAVHHGLDSCCHYGETEVK
jgi:hypothetical protein